jgi:hypothetical protein
MKTNKNMFWISLDIKIANQLILNRQRYLNCSSYKRRTKLYKINNHRHQGLTEYLRKNIIRANTFIIILLMEQLGKARQKNHQNMHIVMIILCKKAKMITQQAQLA